MPRTSSTAAKKTSASRTAHRAPARKEAAPAPKRAASRPAPAKAAPVAKRATAKPDVAQKSPPPGKILAHDVARASRDVLEAQARLKAITEAYMEQQGEILQGAVDHVAAIEALSGPVKQGARPKDSPQEKALSTAPQIGEYYDLEATKALSLVALRELARDLESRNIITETVKKTVILKQMEDAGLFRSEGSAPADEDDLEEADSDDDQEMDEDEEDGEYEDDESDDDDEESEDPTLSELEDATLTQLREWAEEYGVKTAKKSADDLREALAEKLDLNEDDDEDEEDDDEEDDEDEYDDEEEEDEEDEGYLTVADVKKMDHAALLKAAKESNEKISESTLKNVTKLRAWMVKYIEEIEAQQDEDEDED
jgi:hypothetical protein